MKWLLVSIVGFINLVRSWPEMDTTDKIIAGATILAFLAFAGAVGALAVPKVPPPGSFKPGACSKLPESYYSKVVVDMRSAPVRSGTTVSGAPRNAVWFWKQVKSSNPEYLSPKNIRVIKAGKSPRVDAHWVKYHPQHGSFMGETLVHHHMGQGPYATPVPKPIHLSWTKVLHPYRAE